MFDEEIIKAISSSSIMFIAQIQYKQLNMKKGAEPLQDAFDAQFLKLELFKRETHLLELSPNEFEDSTDWLGLTNSEGIEHEFLTIHKYNRELDIITTENEGDLKFPSVNMTVPTTKLVIELADTRNIYSRSNYTFFALLGDFGGFNEAIVLMPAFLMSLYSSK